MKIQRARATAAREVAGRRESRQRMADIAARIALEEVRESHRQAAEAFPADEFPIDARVEAAMQELTDQAQALGMGY